MSDARRIELKMQAPPGDIRRYATAIAAGAVIEYAEEGEIPDSMADASSADEDEDDLDEDDELEADDPTSAGPASAGRSSPAGAAGPDRDATFPPSVGADMPAAGVPAADDDAAPVALSFTCPSCGHAFEPAAVPAEGLLTCPACAAQFFGTAEVSDEDRAAEEQIRLEYEARARRIGDLHRNKVLIERRHQFRTRTYVVLGAAALVITAWQLCAFAAARNRATGSLGVRGAVYLALAVVAVGFLWPCVRKIRAMNRALATPVLTDPETPPDFSTLSDGSQLIDEEVKNLERLSGKKG